MPPGRRKRNSPELPSGKVKEEHSSNYKKIKLENASSVRENKVFVIFQKEFEKELTSLETSLKIKHNQVFTLKEAHPRIGGGGLYYLIEALAFCV